MSFKVKNSQLNNETLGVINQLIDMDINATSAFKLTRIIKVISSIVEDKLKAEKMILDRYVSRDDNGNTIHPKDEAGKDIMDQVSIMNVDAFSAEMAELMNYENEIQFDLLKFEDLGLKMVKIRDLIKVDFLFS